jgi:redox-sensitive bicupin YhaK (pirin superfamily)
MFLPDDNGFEGTRRRSTMTKVLGVYSSPRPHWVGDGFPVRSMFSHATHGQHVSPFLLLDYAGPADFAPAEHKRGVGVHPHRGFETVTIVYRGEVEHRDSTGNGGVIGPGDVQWMTAASGILHEEFHSREFTRKGGTLEMVQLWVNLPAKDKDAAPSYQTLLDRDIPAIALSNEAGTLRVIAGEYEGSRGPARTFTPIDIWDLRLRRGGATSLTLPAGHTAGLVVLRGTVLVNDRNIAREAQFVLLDRNGGELMLSANSDASLLMLGGEPIDEPVVMQGPFVMNTADEIRRAITDFQNGRFGEIHA